ncbi:hypothetical protein [Halocynthiibacter sp.]|uniref:hypothetical protein n=1 Tax=Halocynthiibacter sp. TaxID=1979210 RepID=UPI003C49E0DF
MLRYSTAACIALTFCPAVQAEAFSFHNAPPSWRPDRFSIPLACHHYGKWGAQKKNDFNEDNPGLIMTWENRALELNYSIGAYKDSYSDTTTYLAVSQMWNIHPELQAGIVASYRNSDGNGFTGFAPSLQIIYRNFFLDISHGVNNGDHFGALGLGFTFPLRRD